MLTPKDLQSIASLIKVETDAIRKDMATKSDIQKLKDYIDSKTRIITTVFKVELHETNQRIDTMTNIVKEIKTELKSHRQRIESLEDATLSKPTKN